MKKTINVILAGVLAVPALALGMSLFAPVAQPVSAQAAWGGIINGSNDAQGDDQVNSLFGTNGIFKTISNVLLFLIGAISVIMLIYGGFRYTTSGGDTAAVTTAKNTILYAIVGIVVALLGYAIVNFVVNSIANGGAATA